MKFYKRKYELSDWDTGQNDRYRRCFPMPFQQSSNENMLAKGEIAHNEQFLILQQCFQLFQ